MYLLTLWIILAWQCRSDKNTWKWDNTAVTTSSFQVRREAYLSVDSHPFGWVSWHTSSVRSVYTTCVYFFSHFFWFWICFYVNVWSFNNSKFIVVQGSTVHNCACTQQYIPVYLKICSEGRSQGVSVLTSKQRTKGQKKMRGGDGHVYYLDCGDSNTSGHVCPNTTYVNRVKFFVY